MSEINHPLANGTTVLADITCPSCNLDVEPNIDNFQQVTIINHSIGSDGMVRYKASGVPISQFILPDHILEVINDSTSP